MIFEKKVLKFLTGNNKTSKNCLWFIIEHNQCNSMKQETAAGMKAKTCGTSKHNDAIRKNQQNLLNSSREHQKQKIIIKNIKFIHKNKEKINTIMKGNGTLPLYLDDFAAPDKL